MRNNQDQFLAWLAKRVSASKLSDYYLLIPDVDTFAKNNCLYTGTLFDVLDKEIVLNLIGYLGKKRQNKSMTDFVVLYHKYLVETPSASSNQKKPAVITSSPQKTSQPSKPKITSDTDAFSIPESVLSKKQPPEAMKRFSVNSSGELCASGSEISSVEEKSRTESRKDNAKQKSVEGKEKPAENSGATDSEGKIVDFYHKQSYAFTKPVSVSYFGKLFYESSWRTLYKKLCKLLAFYYPDVFKRLRNQSKSGNREYMVYDSEIAKNLTKPFEVAKGIFVETNRSATDLVESLRKLLDACAVDYENVVIRYVQMPKTSTEEEITAPTATRNNNDSQIPKAAEHTKSKADQTRQVFIAWMRKIGLSSAYSNEYASGILTVSEIGKKSGLTTRSFFEITNPKEFSDIWRKLRVSSEFINHNKDNTNQERVLTIAMGYYSIFLKNYSEEQLETVSLSASPASSASVASPASAETSSGEKAAVPSDTSRKHKEETQPSSVSPPSVATTQIPDAHLFDGLLQDAQYDELRKALIAEGITSVEGLKNINLWAFMNSHNLYSIKERLSVSSELTQYLKQGLEKNASENKKYTVQYNDANYSGDTPSEAFLSFLTAIAIKYPLKFRGLISVIHPETNKIVIRKHAYDKRSKLRMMNPQVYIDSDLSCDEVKLYVAWVLQRCSASPAQFNFYDTKQKSEHLVTVPTDIESDVPVQEAPESTKTEVPAYTESPSSPQEDISPESPEKAGEEATVPDEAGGQPKVFPTPPPRNTQRVEEFLLSCDLEGATISKLQLALSLTMVGTKEAISQSPHILELDHRLYHDEAFVDFEEASDKIEDILDKLLKKNNGIATATQLYEYAKSELSMFLNDNGISGQQAIYDLAKFLFDKVEYHGKRYYFRNNIYISLPEVSADSIISIIQKYAREKGTTVTFSEIENYIKGLGLNGGNLRGLMRIDKEPVFLIYQDNEYLLAELMHMDSDFFDKVKKALAHLFADVGDHIILRRIADNWYRLLPALPSSLDWTPMLLQHLLRFYSKELGARTIMAMTSQSSNTLHAMLVANDCDIVDFRDAVAVFLYEEHPERTSFEAEALRKLLVRAGMLYGNELIYNMHNALKGDPRFLWNSDGSKVTVRL